RPVWRRDQWLIHVDERHDMVRAVSNQVTVVDCIALWTSFALTRARRRSWRRRQYSWRRRNWRDWFDWFRLRLPWFLNHGSGSTHERSLRGFLRRTRRLTHRLIAVETAQSLLVKSLLYSSQPASTFLGF